MVLVTNMNREQIERNIRKAYDLGYTDGLYKAKHEQDIIERVSDKEMIAKFLANNKITTVEQTQLEDVYLGEVRTKG